MADNKTSSSSSSVLYCYSLSSAPILARAIDAIATHRSLSTAVELASADARSHSAKL